MKKLLFVFSFFLFLGTGAKVQAATLDLINFNGGGTYVAGETYELQWRQENIKSVSIMIMTGDSNTGDWIDTSFPVDQSAEIGKHQLLLPENLNGHYQLILTGYFINEEGGKYSMQERSDDSFNVKQEITFNIIKPTKGSILKAGEKHFIEFDRDKGPEYMSLDLDLYKGTEFIRRLWARRVNDALDFDYQYDWTVPVDVVSGDNYRIKVSQHSVVTSQHTINPFPVEAYSDYFSIKSDLDLSINFSMPQKMSQGGSYNVSWSSQCTGGLYALWLVLGENNYKDEGALPYLIQQMVVEDPMLRVLGKEDLGGYWFTPNKNQMLVSIPREKYYNYGRFGGGTIDSSNYPIRYSTDGNYINGITINDSFERDSFREDLQDGQYRFYLQIQGTYNGQPCNISSFSDYFTIGSVSTNVNNNGDSDDSDDDVDDNDDSNDYIDNLDDDNSSDVSVPVTQVDINLSNRLRGKILLQVEDHGEAWYVRPDNGKRMYMRDGSTAYSMMRNLGLGITNADLKKIPIGIEKRFECADDDGDGLCNKLEEGLGTDSNKKDSDGDGFDDGTEVNSDYDPMGSSKLSYDNSLINRLKGQILLQVESRGEAWYINPDDGKRYYMKDGPAAYQIMRFLSLGITNNDLSKIDQD